jgi:hypothetical protein
MHILSFELDGPLAMAAFHDIVVGTDHLVYFAGTPEPKVPRGTSGYLGGPRGYPCAPRGTPRGVPWRYPGGTPVYPGVPRDSPEVLRETTGYFVRWGTPGYPGAAPGYPGIPRGTPGFPEVPRVPRSSPSWLKPKPKPEGMTGLLAPHQSSGGPL